MTVRAIIPRLFLSLAIAAGAMWLVLIRDRIDPALIEDLTRDLGVWAPLAYITLFAVGTVLFVPGAIFGLAGGALFGPLWGTILNLVGATLGATATFLVARYLAGDWVRRKAAGGLGRLVAGVETEGWRFVAFVRLVPLFPFNLTNYALGLTRIPLAHFVLATIVCMVPGTLAYTWLGHAGREAIGGSDTAIRYGVIGLALLAAIAFLPRLLRRWRADSAPEWIETDELATGLRESRGLAVIDVRGPDEFIGPLGHIPGARNLPINDLPNRLGELELLQDKPVVLVCRTDRRSANGARLLRDAGFDKIRVLRDGMEGWTKLGLPVEDKATSNSTRMVR
jgi:uncharacterized membrane protein YdjX (TVP38/TMEM64 family)/rhodanese-related sulfurtransferase